MGFGKSCLLMESAASCGPERRSSDLHLYVIRLEKPSPRTKLRICAGKSYLEVDLNSVNIPFLVKEEFIGSFRLMIRKRHGLGMRKESMEMMALEGIHHMLGLRIEILFCDTWRHRGEICEDVMATARYFEKAIREDLKKMSVSERIISYLFFQNVRSDSSTVYVRSLKSGRIFQEKMYESAKFFTRYLCNKYSCNSYIYNQILKYMSYFVGSRFDSSSSAREIPKFVEFFKIDINEIKKSPGDFKSFNEFFYRELKEGSRVVEDPKGISSPADCRLTLFRSEEEARDIWIKGSMFSIRNITGRSIKASCIALFRLAPMDYHRFHAPFDCLIEDIEEVKGKYLTVHPKSVRVSNVLTENKRVVIRLRSPEYGVVYLVPIGAVFVGSIVISRRRGERLKALDEIGYFKFGGSSILMLMEGKVVPNRNIYLNTLAGIETLVKVGGCIARLEE